MPYYAKINDEGICDGILETYGALSNPDLIEIDSYDLSLLGKKRVGSTWEDVPEPVKPEPPIPTTPTITDVMTKLTTMDSKLSSVQTDVGVIKTGKLPISMLLPYEIHDVPQQATRPWNVDLVNAPSFWTKTKGGRAVVAVIDTGLDVHHPDLTGRIFKPFNLTTIDTGVVNDIVGHGTHVAGIIASSVKGIAPEARIMPLKVFPDDPNNKNAGWYIQQAFLHVLDYNKTAPLEDKVVVVNCSFGGEGYDVYMGYLIRRLTETGVTVVVSAGNAGDGDPETYECYSFPAFQWECLTVGATNQDGTIAKYSNSFDGIDIGAPGTLIESCWPGGQYRAISGTSMAAPHVSGAMALIYDAWRIREGSWPTEEQAVSVLMKHTRKTSIDSRFVGEGVLDLTWSNLRWPLYRIQLGAYYNKAYRDEAKNKLDALDIATYAIKY